MGGFEVAYCQKRITSKISRHIVLAPFGKIRAKADLIIPTWRITVANPPYSFRVIILHKYRFPLLPEARSNLADKAQGEGNGESSNRAKYRDRMPSRVSPGSSECNRNVFRSLVHPGFGVPSSAVAKWFAPVSAVGIVTPVI